MLFPAGFWVWIRGCVSLGYSVRCAGWFSLCGVGFVGILIAFALWRGGYNLSSEVCLFATVRSLVGLPQRFVVVVTFTGL